MMFVSSNQVAFWEREYHRIVAENKKLQAEIERLRKEISPEPEPVPSEFDNWHVSITKKGYIRLFRRIDDKTLWLHIGRLWNSERVRKKITGFCQEKGLSVE